MRIDARGKRLPAFGRALIERLQAREYVNVRIRVADDAGWREAARYEQGDVLLLEPGHDPFAIRWPVADLHVLVVIEDDNVARRCCAALIAAGAQLAVAVPQLFVHRAQP